MRKAKLLMLIVSFVIVVVLVGSFGSGQMGFGGIREDIFNTDKISAGLLEEFEESKGEAVKVIINVREEDGSVPESTDIMDSVIETLVDSEIIEIFKTDAFVVILNKNEAKSLTKNINVFFLEEIKYFKPALEDAVEIIDAVETWDLEVSGENLEGTGQTICIVDTGVDFTHPDLDDKNILGCNLNCMVSGCPSDCTLTDTDGHGTHVAGIAAASGGISGIAKGANIISAKIFPEGGTNINIRRALDWCLDNREDFNISVISMSVSSPTLYGEHCDSDNGLISTGVNNAIAENIASVASAGNNANSSAISAPACLENVIPVANTDKDDNVWSSSNYNSLVKLFAPGGLITSTCIPDDDPDGDGYCIKSGTSMSTPMVSGSIAIINQLLALNGEQMSLNPKTEIEPLLFDKGEPIVGLSDSWKRINIFNAILTLLPVMNEPPVITSSPVLSGSVGVSYSYDVDATDPDDDTLEYSLTISPAGMTINSVTGLISWNSPVEGSHAVTIEVTDNEGGFDDQSYTLQISGKEPTFVRGNANGDAQVNIADATYILNYLFSQGADPRCFDAADANDDGTVNIADATYILNYLFSQGPEPPSPFPDPGVDPTGDGLSC